jgi:hypothetical protein
VPLAPVSDPAEIVPTIAEALGLALTGNSELISQLLTYLRDQGLLLVLDNLGTCLTVKAAPPIWCSGCWCRHANRQHICGGRRHLAMLGGAPDAADATGNMLADLAHAPCDHDGETQQRNRGIIFLSALALIVFLRPEESKRISLHRSLPERFLSPLYTCTQTVAQAVTIFS